MACALVIQLARFGDLVQTKRLLLSLAGEETHLCVDRSLAPLARLLYPQVAVHSVAAHGGSPSEIAECNQAAFIALKAEDFHRVYNLNHSPLNRALAGLFPAATVCGHFVDQGQARRSPWVDMALRWAGQRPLSPLNLTDFWAFFHANPLPPHRVNPVARPGGKGLGVVLAGRAARRSLPPHILGPCVRAVFESLGGPDIYLFGTRDDYANARSLTRHFSPAMLGKLRNLCGKTDWPGLIDALTGLDCLLSPDTGTMHLAAHKGVPVQAFFLSSAWCHETGPYGVGHLVWQANTECLPCLEGEDCAFDVQCLHAFAQPGFLFALAESTGEVALPNAQNLPARILHMESGLDALGSVWNIRRGDDPRSMERGALRRLIGEYLGYGLSAGEQPASTHFYQEKDWMLTRLAPQSGLREYY